ncbi:MAG: TonB-dependent receptor [Candidatus Latescibacterota bacterium]|jgi:hemoglobin/transferrin/lactoferrin receptor protein
MRSRLLLALLTVGVTAVASLGAALSGRVVGEASAAPLAGAYVTVTGTALATFTDDQGRYTLTGVPLGMRQVTASHVGHRTVQRLVEMTAVSTAVLDLVLPATLLPVEGVVVSSRGRPSRLTELAGSAAAVSSVELERETPVSLSAAVAAVPGVALGSDMPWSSRVQVRGLDRDHVVFLINGNRVSTTNEVAAQFGTVALPDVEQVEVLKGPVSVLYGTGSTGGVVNVIPRSGRFAPAARWSAALSLAHESVADGWSGYLRGGLDGPRYYLLVSQAYRDYGTYTSGGEAVANSQFRDWQTHLNLGLRLTGSQSLDLRYQWFEARDVGIPGGGSVYPLGATVRYPSTGRRLAEATWRWTRPGAAWHRSELRLFQQAVDRRAEVLPIDVRYLAATDTQPLRRVRPQSILPEADHDAAGIRWHNETALLGHRLVWGLDAWQKELSSFRRRVTETDVLRADSSVVKTTETVVEDRSFPNSTYRPIGIYAEDEVAIEPRLTLSGGARVDVIEVSSATTYRTYLPVTDQVLWPATDDRDLSWSAQARLTAILAPGWQAYANLARSFRSPGIEERYLYVDLGNLVKVGDPRLNSESGRYAEIGLSLTTDRVLWKAQAFRNRIDDLVIDVPATFEGRAALQKTNAGSALFVGAESELSVSPRPGLLLSGDLAYVRGRDEKADRNLPGIAPLNGHLTAQVGRPEGTWGRAELELAGKQDRVAPGESPTDGHRTVNLSAGYGGLRWGGMQHRFTVGLRNALDAHYRDHLATSRGFDLTAPGRSLHTAWTVEM